jgi:CBS-domain-containing membrane protein
MLARDIMTRTVVTVTATTTVPEAATLLAAHGFTALPVVNDDGALIGLLTEVDILRDRFPRDPRFHCSDEGSIQRPDTREPAATVGGVMTSPAPSVRDGADVVDLVTIMRADGLRSMPVVDGPRLVGIVTAVIWCARGPAVTWPWPPTSNTSWSSTAAAVAGPSRSRAVR